MSRRVALDEQPFTELFAEEKSLKTASWEEAANALRQDFVYRRPEIQMNTLEMDEMMGVRFDGERYRMTEKALVDVCGLVHPPVQVGFANALPRDLAADLLQRLSYREQRTMVPCIREDVVVACIDPARYGGSKGPARYEPVPLGEVLDLSKNLWKPDQRVEITVSDRGMMVSLVGAELAVAPEVDDITQVGVRIEASETGGPQPDARAFALRLVCLNGQTLPVTFGQARFSSDPRVKMARRLETWARAMADLQPQVDLEILRATYQKMSKEAMTDVAWRALYRNTNNAFRRNVLRAPGVDKAGRTPADRVLGVERNERLAIVKTLGQREREAQREGRAVEPAPTPWTIYDVMNRVTAAARDETPARRAALEELAGTLVADYRPAMN